MRRLFIATALIFVCLGAGDSRADRKPMPYEDRVRIAEGRRMAAALGDRLWPGWQDAPFAVLLVTKQAEYLVYHPKPSDEFAPLGFDSLLQSEVYVRDRQFDPHLLATFPAVGGLPTITIGQPRNTDASHSTRWVITLLHEHFHQWQMSQPDYYRAVEALGLSDGDKSGMWMLDYPFPYDDKKIGEAFRRMCESLHDAVSGSGSQDYFADYFSARARFGGLLDEDDHRYFLFQIWQEGIARYTEYMIARQAEVAYRPTDRFGELPDVTRFGEDAQETWGKVLNELRNMSLKKSRREAFYYVGAALGVLLDRETPGWRDRYLEDKFSVEGYYPQSKGE